VFTARYALSPYIKQIHFVFKGLKVEASDSSETFIFNWYSIWHNTTISLLSVSKLLHPPVLSFSKSLHPHTVDCLGQVHVKITELLVGSRSFPAVGPVVRGAAPLGCTTTVAVVSMTVAVALLHPHRGQSSHRILLSHQSTYLPSPRRKTIYFMHLYHCETQGPIWAYGKVGVNLPLCLTITTGREGM
jgi:hypothetical protein